MPTDQSGFRAALVFPSRSDRKEVPRYMFNKKRNRTILVVDDDRSEREAMCRLLEEDGYTVLAAADYWQASSRPAAISRSDQFTADRHRSAWKQRLRTGQNFVPRGPQSEGAVRFQPLRGRNQQILQYAGGGAAPGGQTISSRRLAASCRDRDPLSNRSRSSQRYWVMREASKLDEAPVKVKLRR